MDSRFKNEIIICIVNAGFTGEVMTIASSLGVHGGTMVHARGTATKEIESIFNISVDPEKDMIFMVVDSSIVDNVLKAIYEKLGTGTDANGVAFALPVTNQVGIK